MCRLKTPPKEPAGIFKTNVAKAGRLQSSRAFATLEYNHLLYIEIPPIIGIGVLIMACVVISKRRSLERTENEPAQIDLWRSAA
jgi:hypothetical protein